MKIAFDGGAFQQGIAGGIYSVAANFINAATALRDDLSFILVGESRWGPMNPALVAALRRPVDVVYGPVGPSYGRRRGGLTTDDQQVRFEVDGEEIPAEITPTGYAYEGPRPHRRLRLVSAVVRPADHEPGGDPRALGLSLTGLTVRANGVARVISIHDPALHRGFHDKEADHVWTRGAAEIPVDRLDLGAERIRLEVDVGGRLPKPLAGGAFDAGYRTVMDQIDGVRLRIETDLLERELLARGAQLYFANHFIPARFERLPTVAWLYDMIPMLFPAFFLGDAGENFAENVRLFRRAKHIFSISDCSKADLVRLAKLPTDKITTASIDVTPVYRPQSAEAIAAAQSRYGLTDRPYLLCVGTLEPRKNHKRLIEAFDLAYRELGFPVRLVTVGKRGWGYEPALDAVNRLGLARHVTFLSDVGDPELAALYGGALFSVYPSIYEGFGLPILESLACHCPVLASNTSSMPEIVGDAGLLVDPLDVHAIAEGLVTLWADDPLRERLVKRGARQRSRYSWSESAAKVLERLPAIAGERR